MNLADYRPDFSLDYESGGNSKTPPQTKSAKNLDSLIFRSLIFPLVQCIAPNLLFSSAINTTSSLILLTMPTAKAKQEKPSDEPSQPQKKQQKQLKAKKIENPLPRNTFVRFIILISND